jgi:putative membrane protein
LKLRIALLAIVVVVLVLSGIGPYDRLTWWLEVAPVLIALPLIVATHRRFPLSTLAVVLIAIHAVILCVGGHYTYARVPIGAWVSEQLGWQRNHYDRLGHVAQGFVPAILAREILLRTSPLRRGGWLTFLVLCVVLAISALYELVEWWSALLNEEAAAAFLGTQGDVWDTQWDMFLALLGGVAALLTLSRTHDRALTRLPRRNQAE